MDRIERYRKIICDFLEDFAEYDREALLVFDRDRDRYLVIHAGWRGEARIYGTAIHLDLIDGQIWLQHNSTEIYVDRELVDRGVDANDIILGLRSPAVRDFLASRQPTQPHN